MNPNRGSSNLLIGLLAAVVIVVVIGAIAVLAYQYNLLQQATPAPITARPVLVTQIVPGTDLTARAFPTLPPEWTVTPTPTASATQPTDTPRPSETSTITPTFPPTDTPAPTGAGPTRTHAPTWTPTFTPTVTPTNTPGFPNTATPGAIVTQ